MAQIGLSLKLTLYEIWGSKAKYTEVAGWSSGVGAFGATFKDFSVFEGANFAKMSINF